MHIDMHFRPRFATFSLKAHRKYAAHMQYNPLKSLILHIAYMQSQISSIIGVDTGRKPV